MNVKFYRNLYISVKFKYPEIYLKLTNLFESSRYLRFAISSMFKSTTQANQIEKTPDGNTQRSYRDEVPGCNSRKIHLLGTVKKQTSLIEYIQVNKKRYDSAGD